MRTSLGAPQAFPLNMVLPDDDDESDEGRAECEGLAYDKLDETKNIAITDGYVTFMRLFHYLGSLVSYKPQ